MYFEDARELDMSKVAVVFITVVAFTTSILLF